MVSETSKTDSNRAVNRTNYRVAAVLTLALYASDAESARKIPDGKYPLRGCRASLQEQNDVAREDELSRIQDNAMLTRFVRKGYLVEIPAQGKGYVIDGRIPHNYRYTRPWTLTFLGRLGSQYYTRFDSRFKVTSAVRTVERQRILDRRNVNASSADGELVSSHLYGATIDISKKGMTGEQLRWMRETLIRLDEKDVIDAVEERATNCFHVCVYRDEYKNYVKSKAAKKSTRRK